MAKFLRYKRGLIILVIVAILIVGAAIALRHSHTSHNKPVALDAKLLNSLPQRTNNTVDTSHLASGVTPPTNHWFSGIALNKEPKAVFPLPLSFKPSDSGFAFGQPIVTATANTITGGYYPAITIDLHAANYKITRYDDVSVSLRYDNASGSSLGTMTLAEGSPFVTYSSTTDQQLSVKGFTQTGDKNVYTQSIGSQTYALVVGGGASYDGTTANLPDKSFISMYPVAKGTTAGAMASYAHPVTSVAAAYGVASDVTTTLTYNTTGGDTLYAALPEQEVHAEKQGGTYETIYGTLTLCKGNNFTFTTSKVAPSDSLDIAKLTTEEKAQLKQQLASDTLATDLTKTDSYFGGKELYRAANLYQLAKQLGANDQANTLKQAIEADLAEWYDPKSSTVRSNRYFYYDTTVKGLVAAEPSFGSEQFNDHHFHYGYFLYATAVMNTYDTNFAKKYEPFVRLIANDIAASSSSKYFPAERVFDPYFGHSWASGYGQFDDGNNQESSSEAINAWNGLGMWAKSVGDSQLSQQAIWQLSRETSSSFNEWIDPDLSNFTGFNHKTIGISWGGKRDYGTFFSSEPAAIFGIQLIPMNPSMQSLAANMSNIAADLAQAVPDGNYDRQFGDYLAMYRSLVDKSGALSVANSIGTTNIDNANSRTYMLAWIMTR